MWRTVLPQNRSKLKELALYSFVMPDGICDLRFAICDCSEGKRYSPAGCPTKLDCARRKGGEPARNRKSQIANRKSLLNLPALAVVVLHVCVGVGAVGRLHLFAVPLQLS